MHTPVVSYGALTHLYPIPQSKSETQSLPAYRGVTKKMISRAIPNSFFSTVFSFLKFLIQFLTLSSKYYLSVLINRFITSYSTSSPSICQFSPFVSQSAYFSLDRLQEADYTFNIAQRQTQRGDRMRLFTGHCRLPALGAGGRRFKSSRPDFFKF